MRELNIEQSSTVFKHRRRNMKEGPYDVKDYQGGMSFSITETNRWYNILWIRYFVQMGDMDNAEVRVTQKVDINQKTIEVIYNIHGKVKNNTKKVINNNPVPHHRQNPSTGNEEKRIYLERFSKIQNGGC